MAGQRHGSGIENLRRSMVLSRFLKIEALILEIFALKIEVQTVKVGRED
jgi:hypothetical protein